MRSHGSLLLTSVLSLVQASSSRPQASGPIHDQLSSGPHSSHCQVCRSRPLVCVCLEEGGEGGLCVPWSGRETVGCGEVPPGMSSLLPEGRQGGRPRAVSRLSCDSGGKVRWSL